MPGVARRWKRKGSILPQTLLGACASARDLGTVGSILGLGRSLGGGHGNQLQYSCLENPMDRGAWQAMVQRVAQNQTQLKQLGTYMLILK